MNEQEPVLQDQEELRMLESMQPDEIVDRILNLGEQATDIEHKMNLASYVLEGAYGITVEDALRERRSRRGA